MGLITLQGLISCRYLTTNLGHHKEETHSHTFFCDWHLGKRLPPCANFGTCISLTRKNKKGKNKSVKSINIRAVVSGGRGPENDAFRFPKKVFVL